MIARMQWLREIAVVLGLGAALWGVFVAYETLAKKNEVEELERVLKSGLLELARCVDNPQYVLASDPEQPVPNCETMVFRALNEDGGQ